jgi:transposase
MTKTTNKFSSEVRERAVRMIGEHRADYPSEWSAMTSIAGKIGCTAETLRRWYRTGHTARWRAGGPKTTESDMPSPVGDAVRISY